MTMDTFHHGNISSKVKSFSMNIDALSNKARAASGKNGIELTRSQAFLDGHQDVFDMLDYARPANTQRAPDAAEKAAMSDYIEKALGLLNKATSIITRAEHQIAQQNMRIENLEGLSTIDELTGLLNRRGFLKTFAREINRTERRNEKGGLLVLIDIENYNKLNEQFDIRTAQKAVFVASKLLKNNIRDMDAASRTDKDEFILMLADTTPDEAMERVQRLAMQLNHLSFTNDHGQELDIHVSISLKAYKAGDTLSKLAGISEQNQKAIQMEENPQYV